MLHGSIHGRFQPFHNAHLAYAKAALERTDMLYVGLSRVLTEDGLGQGIVPHRFDAAENPLPYYSRAQLIERVLVDHGVPRDRFRIGPFPIENIARLPEFWPREFPCFTTNVSNWNEMKIATLRAAGYAVEVLELEQLPNFTSGTRIRELARAGDVAWKSFVPHSSLQILEGLAPFQKPI